jgi:apolipoprotein N-acyltransferase
MRNTQSKFPFDVDRWSYLWLVLSGGLGFFASGPWLIPAAPWLVTVFAIRFLRTQPVWRGFIILVFTSIVVNAVTLVDMTPLPFPLSTGFIAVQVLFGSLPLLADRLLARRIGGLPGTLLFPLAATAWEFVNLTNSPMGSFGSLAYTQYGNLALMQLVSLTGLWGITYLMNWFATLINWAWEKRFAWPLIRRGVLMYMVLLGLAFGYGYARLLLAPTPTQSARLVGITAAVHPLPQVLSLWKDDRAAFQAAVQANHAAYLEATVREARAGAQLVAWPEGAGLGSSTDVAELVARGQGIARQEVIYLAMPVVVLYETEETPAENKLIIVDPKGAIVLEHVKYGGNFLEGTRLGDGILRSVETPFGKLMAVICWDADFVGTMRQAGRAGVDLLLVSARDWQGIDPLHAQMTVFRAIENGVAVLRVAEEGLSLAADPYGRVLASQDYFTTTNRVLVAQAPIKAHAPTLYPWIGDLFGWLTVVGFVALTLWAMVRGRRLGVQRVDEGEAASVLSGGSVA